MKGSISILDDASTPEIAIDEEGDSIRIFRSPGRDEEVVAKKNGEITGFGVQDASVSREFDGKGRPGYIEFTARDGKVYVRDAGSTWGAAMKNQFDEIDISDGEAHPLSGDCQIDIGWNTNLKVTVKDELSHGGRISTYAELVKELCEYATVEEIQHRIQTLQDLMVTSAMADDAHQELLEEVSEAVTMCKQTDYENIKGEVTRVKDVTDLYRKLRGITTRIHEYYEKEG